MKRRKIIQNFFGWVLLALFTFSITPRQLLHDVLADHTDFPTKISQNNTVAKKSFSCDRLNLVAESPFTADDGVAEKVALRSFTKYIAFPDHSYTPEAFSQLSLRGPPCI